MVKSEADGKHELGSLLCRSLSDQGALCSSQPCLGTLRSGSRVNRERRAALSAALGATPEEDYC